MTQAGPTLPETAAAQAGTAVFEETVSDLARPDQPLRGEAPLAAADRGLLRMEGWLGKGLPNHANPLAWTGALSALAFLVAVVSGVLMLFWYSTSVHHAWDSVAVMNASRFGAGFVRALHRYSSDACMLFGVIHALKVLAARRFTGPRSLAWVTGLLLLGLLWVLGWTGYWLVWDTRGQAVATATAHVLDALPIFPEPVARSYLTNNDINSLIFFAVFFAHVLLPVPMCFLLWVHLVRLRKPKFLPPRSLTMAALAAMAALSLVLPASLAARADMAAYPDGFAIDWFYLFPLHVMERMPPWAFWVLALGLLLGLSALPWLAARSRPVPARTDVKRCNGCTQCYQDCPYEAITMVPAEGKANLVSQINPDRCVSCGVCVGSCDPAAVEYEDLQRRDVRDRLTRWLREPGRDKDVVFLCADGAGRAVRHQKATGLSRDLPGWRVVAVPCAAWVHSSLAEQIARGGGRCVIVGCGGTEPRCRLGSQIAADRVLGKRDPVFDAARLGPDCFKFLELNSTHRASVTAALQAAFERPAGDAPPQRNVLTAALAGLAALLLFGGATALGSEFTYVAPDRPEAMLVVAFKHAGKPLDSESAVETELPHLKGMKKRAELAPVRLRVLLDGSVIHEGIYHPRGIKRNSASVGLAELGVSPGKHRVEVLVGETPDASEWTWRASTDLDFTPRRRRVVQFDADAGFRWD